MSGRGCRHRAACPSGKVAASSRQPTAPRRRLPPGGGCSSGCAPASARQTWGALARESATPLGKRRTPARRPAASLHHLVWIACGCIRPATAESCSGACLGATGRLLALRSGLRMSLEGRGREFGAVNSSHRPGQGVADPTPTPAMSAVPWDTGRWHRRGYGGSMTVMKRNRELGVRRRPTLHAAQRTIATRDRMMDASTSLCEQLSPSALKGTAAYRGDRLAEASPPVVCHHTPSSIDRGASRMTPCAMLQSNRSDRLRSGR